MRLQRYGNALDTALTRLDTLAADIKSDAVKRLSAGDMAVLPEGPSEESP